MPGLSGLGGLSQGNKDVSLVACAGFDLGPVGGQKLFHHVGSHWMQEQQVSQFSPDLLGDLLLLFSSEA